MEGEKEIAVPFPGCGVPQGCFGGRLWSCSWGPPKDGCSAVHKSRPSTGFRGPCSAGFDAAGSLPSTFPVLSAGAGCVIVRKQLLSLLPGSACGGH